MLGGTGGFCRWLVAEYQHWNWALTGAGDLDDHCVDVLVFLVRNQDDSVEHYLVSTPFLGAMLLPVAGAGFTQFPVDRPSAASA
jgi:hypothetical protein